MRGIRKESNGVINAVLERMDLSTHVEPLASPRAAVVLRTSHRLMLRDFGRFGVVCRFTLGRLLDFGVGGRLVGMAGRRIVRFTRFGIVRAATYRGGMAFGKQYEQGESGAGC
jgi:hypothetical protein